MKLPVGTVAVIFALALAIWVVSYIASVPLDRNEVVVVLGLSAAVVLAIRWMWRKVHPSGGQHGQQ